jgi:predicted nucleic acid-binding protein
MKFRNALYDAHYRFSTSLSPERHKADAAAQATDWLELFPCAAASNSAVRTALADAAAGRASYGDALLLATAGEAGCVAVLTEDLVLPKIWRMALSWVVSESITRSPQEEGSPIRRAGC